MTEPVLDPGEIGEPLKNWKKKKSQCPDFIQDVLIQNLWAQDLSMSHLKSSPGDPDV